MPSQQEQDGDAGHTSNNRPSASPPSWLKDGANALIGAIVGAAVARFSGAGWFVLLTWTTIVFGCFFAILKYATKPWLRRLPVIILVCALLGSGAFVVHKWNAQRRPPSKTIILIA